MNTPSHWLMTVAAGHVHRKKTGQKSPKWALALGAIAPDLPLYLLSFGAIWYFGSYLDWPSEEVGQHVFSNLYYKDPVWISLHNFLHSPTMIAILFAGLFLAEKADWLSAGARRWCGYFLIACLFHSLTDIFAHNDDGPVLFYPLNWTYRFSSPVSYWDRDHFAAFFMVFEAILDLLLIGFLIWAWRASKKPARELSVSDQA